MTTRAKIPTRREIRATVLSAMATTLDNDAFGTDADYLYDCVADAPDEDQRAYRARVKAVVEEIIDEFSRRAERLRK